MSNYVMCEVCLLDWVRASTRVLSVVCGVERQQIVVNDRNVLFNNADYKVITEVTSAGLLTASSAGVTVCSILFICQAG